MWKTISLVQQQELRDVIYDKAHGEGIAKVSQQGQKCTSGSRLKTSATLAFPFGKMRMISWAVWLAQITIDRPEKRNAFRPETIEEIMRCMTDARDDPDIGVIVLTGSSLLHAASSSLKRPINVLVELFSMAVTQTQQMQVCKALHLHLLHRGAGLPPDNALSWPTVPLIGP